MNQQIVDLLERKQGLDDNQQSIFPKSASGAAQQWMLDAIAVLLQRELDRTSART
jgi:hypothetical protein